MKTISKFSILLFFMAIAFACKKTDTTPAEVCKVTSFKSYNEKSKTTETIQYEYNTDGKINKMSYSPIVAAYKNQAYETISYSSTAVVFTLYDDKNKVISTTTYQLNTAGYVTKIDYGSSYLVTYEYDSQGFLSKSSSSGAFSGGNYTYTYTDGNLTSVKGFDDKGKATDATTNEYYLDKSNGLKLETIYEKNILGQSLFGNGSKNLLKKTTYSSGSTTIITDFTYTFDAKGNPTQIFQKASNGSNYTIDLVYLCK
jgi:hypothetical protein